jgi:hypothetical protein
MNEVFRYLQSAMSLPAVVLEFAIEYSDSLFPAVAAYTTATTIGAGVSLSSLILENIAPFKDLKRVTDILWYGKWGGAAVSAMGGVGMCYSLRH